MINFPEPLFAALVINLPFFFGDYVGLSNCGCLAEGCGHRDGDSESMRKDTFRACPRALSHRPCIITLIQVLVVFNRNAARIFEVTVKAFLPVRDLGSMESLRRLYRFSRHRAQSLRQVMRVELFRGASVQVQPSRCMAPWQRRRPRGAWHRWDVELAKTQCFCEFFDGWRLSVAPVCDGGRGQLRLGLEIRGLLGG